MHLKFLQKEQFKMQLKQLAIWLVIELLIKLQKSLEVQHGIVQRQMKVKQEIYDLTEKYQKIDISSEKRRWIIDKLRLI